MRLFLAAFLMLGLHGCVSYPTIRITGRVLMKDRYTPIANSKLHAQISAGTLVFVEAETGADGSYEIECDFPAGNGELIPFNGWLYLNASLVAAEIAQLPAGKREEAEEAAIEKCDNRFDLGDYYVTGSDNVTGETTYLATRDIVIEDADQAALEKIRHCQLEVLRTF